VGAISFSIDERLLAFLVKELPLKLFVETGTYKGASLEVALRFFSRCESVEASPQLHEQARARFELRDNVRLHLGDSPSFLRQRQAEFARTPTVFWLDAHWCNQDHTSGVASQSPLLGELEAIGSLHRDSVVLIDDARLYLCAPPAPHRFENWPDLHSVAEALLRLSTRHRMMILNDVLIFYPTPLQTQAAEFAHQHGADWLHFVDYYRLKQRLEEEAQVARNRVRRPFRYARDTWRRYFGKAG
jgi:hypothetical protein